MARKMEMGRKMGMSREMEIGREMEMEGGERNGDGEIKECTVYRIKDMYSCAIILAER
jgi:hypothetical protein